MDPLSGPDGTAPARDDDALSGTGALPPDHAATDLRLPALPALGGPGTDGDRAALARWMDEDRARSDAVPASERAQWTAPPRDVPPPRVVPRRPDPPSSPGPVPEPRGELPGPVEEDVAEDDEPPWVRERREEHEFQRQFGEWRPGAGPRRRGGGVPAPVLLLLLAVIVLVAWTALR